MSCPNFSGITSFPLILRDGQGPFLPSPEVSQTFVRFPARRHAAWASHELSEAVTLLSRKITACEKRTAAARHADDLLFK